MTPIPTCAVDGAGMRLLRETRSIRASLQFRLDGVEGARGKADRMRTAYCFTPDGKFFPPAVRAIASILEAEPDFPHEILIVCEPQDVTPGFDRLPRALRDRITLKTLDFAIYDEALKPKGRFSRAVFRRLFLDDALPAGVERIVTIDSDMLMARAGLSRLASVDLGGRPLAAAYDMIFLMDFKDDALARRFQRARLSLGMALDTPYFNAGLMTIDRAAWRAAKVGDRVSKALAEHPERYPFMEQDALNATLKGDFAPLSPRYNFMGDFLLLDLERRIDPIVLHFVIPPKPWQAGYRGEARFAAAFRDWFAASPWPDWAIAPEAQASRRGRPAMTALKRRFAAGLTTYLEGAPFIDGRLTLDA